MPKIYARNRHERYMLLQPIMIGKMEGKRRAGRNKNSWLCNIGSREIEEEKEEVVSLL